jgi:hypothetical protein
MIEIKHRHTGAVIHTHDGASLAGANLSRADLARADLAGANLTGANLYDADLTWANLAGANLTRANLTRANLAWADLFGAKITPDHALVGTRPLLQIGPLGSRGAMLLAFRTDKGLVLRTGCFFGTPEEFEAVARHTHGDSTHAADYLSALVFMRDWFARSE